MLSDSFKNMYFSSILKDSFSRKNNPDSKYNIFRLADIPFFLANSNCKYFFKLIFGTIISFFSKGIDKLKLFRNSSLSFTMSLEKNKLHNIVFYKILCKKFNYCNTENWQNLDVFSF